jgi:hypothetical protein
MSVALAASARQLTGRPNRKETTMEMRNLVRLVRIAGSALLMWSSLAGCGTADDPTMPATTEPASVEKSAVVLGSGDPAHRLDYAKCADESQTCILGAGKYVAYGAGSQFFFKVASGAVACTNDTFGDPAPGMVKACYFANYSLVVAENGVVNVAPSNIAYGANGVFNFRQLSGTFTCNNATFGDPIPGTPKACYRALGLYDQVASEGQTFLASATQPVAYGANGRFVYQILSGSVSCNNTTFGDPAPGVPKVCYAFGQPRQADEGQVVLFQGIDAAVFYFGTGLDGNFLAKVEHGGFSCSNSEFGGDPHFGIVKHCYGP